MNWRGVLVPPTTTTPMDRSKHAGHFACWLADYTRAAVRFGKLKIQLRARVCCRSRSLFMKSCVAKRLCVRKTATWNAAALAKYCVSANIISWEFGRDDRRLLPLYDVYELRFSVFYNISWRGLVHLFATPQESPFLLPGFWKLRVQWIISTFNSSWEPRSMQNSEGKK
jgi:hypothetical protein